MMTDQSNDGEFASVVWDTPDEAQKQGDAASNPLDSATTSSAAAGGTTADHRSEGGEMARRSSHGDSGPSGVPIPGGSASAGPSSSSGAAAGRYYIKATVGDPTKMLEGTKDAFITYMVKGEVSTVPSLVQRWTRS